MTKFKDLSIGKKTLLGFGTLLAIFLTAIAVILLESNALRTAMEAVTHETEMVNQAKDMEIEAISVLTYFGEIAASPDEASLKEAMDGIAAHRDAYTKKMETLSSSVRSPETKALITSLSEALIALREPNGRVLAFSREGKRAEAARVFAKESIPGIMAWQRKAIQLTDRLQVKLDAATQSEQEAVRAVLFTIAIAGVAATLAALFLGLSMARGITRPIHTFMAALKTFSEADFTVKVKVESADEIGQLGATLNAAIQRLRGTIHEVSDAALAVSSGATQLSATSDEMARATHEIAKGSENINEATESVAAAMIQFQASVDQVEANVEVSVQHTAESVMAADIGLGAARTIEERMGRIHAATSRIANAVSVIREIAQQSNLLSLNAAIEAAKAGQHGKGFSVVAEEVRKLAERSRQATVEIAALIEETNAAVDDGTLSTQDTVQQIQGIHDAIATVSSQVREIGSAAHEQASTMGEITTRIEDTSREISQNAAASQELSATVEQVSRTATSLAEVSEKLKKTVSIFQL